HRIAPPVLGCDPALDRTDRRDRDPPQSRALADGGCAPPRRRGAATVSRPVPRRARTPVRGPVVRRHGTGDPVAVSATSPAVRPGPSREPHRPVVFAPD